MFTVKTTRCRYNTLVDIVATVSVDADGNLVVWWYVVYADEASAQAAASDLNIHPSVTPAMCSQNQIQSQGHARRPHEDAMFEGVTDDNRKEFETVYTKCRAAKKTWKG